MSIWDIINPWGALRRERRALINCITEYEGCIVRMETHLRRDNGHLTAANDALLDEVYKLKATIAKGHFRNPETGRIGPVGKVYE